MQTSSNNLFTAISKEQTEQLTTITKETLAVEFNNNHKNFGAVDLWNIHRQRRNLASKRNFS